MEVRRIMTSNVAACRPETNLAAAAGLMWRHDCGAIPVNAPDRAGIERCV